MPDQIDFEYLEKAGVDWVRVTPYILDYIDGKRSVDGVEGVDNIIRAGELGYKVALGFRWDFKKRGLRLPKPGTAAEEALFDHVRLWLGLVGSHVDIFKLGNEPNFETMKEDLQFDAEGQIPLVTFTRRLLTEVVEPFYAERSDWQRPKIYVGSIVWPYDEVQQQIPATLGLLRFCQESSAVDGLAIHLHLRGIGNLEESFAFIRAHVPEKPIIVPEFSLQRLYRAHLKEQIGVDAAGREFAERYGRNPKWEMYRWINYALRNEVSPNEWKDFFASRSWYPNNYFQRYYEAFSQNGVVLGTYPLRFGKTRLLSSNSVTWSLNPIFVDWPLSSETGRVDETNPLCFEDFQAAVNAGKVEPRKDL